MKEVTDILVGIDLFLQIGNRYVLGVVGIEPGPPGVVDLGLVLHAFDDGAEEFRPLVTKGVDADGLEVEPGLLVQPRHELLLVVDTTTGLKEHVDVRVGEFTILN